MVLSWLWSQSWLLPVWVSEHYPRGFWSRKMKQKVSSSWRTHGFIEGTVIMEMKVAGACETSLTNQLRSQLSLKCAPLGMGQPLQHALPLKIIYSPRYYSALMLTATPEAPPLCPVGSFVRKQNGWGKMSPGRE